MASAKSILITGATGNQGGAVLRQLAALATSSQFSFLAVTRNPTSPAAIKLKKDHPGVLLVQGSLDNVPAVFKAAQTELKTAGKGENIWGVYSVQSTISGNPKNPPDNEVKQGKALIDASLQYSVKHFVYSSVDRGGNEKSFNYPTDVAHFKSKDEIEQYLLRQAGAKGEKMGWTILRPVAFMDNLEPGIQSKVLLTALRDTLRGKSVQWIACEDIGRFAARAFDDPVAWNARAEALAGDELTADEMDKVFKNVTGQDLPTTFGFLGAALRITVKDMRLMIDFFRDVGFGTDIARLRQQEPQLLNFETWLGTKSKFPKKA